MADDTFFGWRISPLTRRRLHNFRANRRGFWSLWIFLVLFGVSLFAEVIANDRPLTGGGGELVRLVVGARLRGALGEPRHACMVTHEGRRIADPGREWAGAGGASGPRHRSVCRRARTRATGGT